MQYSWTDETIKNRVHKLKTLYDSCTDEEQRKIIKAQIDYVNSFLDHIQTDYRQPKMLEAYTDLKNYVYREKFSWNTIFNYINNTSEGFSLVTPSHLEISDDDIVAITHDFYKTLSKDIYDAYLKFYRTRYDHIRFDQFQKGKGLGGYAYLLPSLQENFASITRTNTICDVFASIHESGHIIWSILNEKYLGLANSYIEELIPYTIELIASDYLENIFGDESLKYKGANHAMMAMNNQKWAAFMELVAVEKEEFEKFKNLHELKKAGKMLGIKPRELSSLLNLVKFPEMYRIIPYIYAIELYYMFKKDPELTYNVMQKIMKDETEKPEESLEMLEKQGIIANEHSSKFHQNMILTLKPICQRHNNL